MKSTITGDQVGDARAPMGSPAWVQSFRLHLKVDLDRAEQSVGGVKADLELMRDNEWFRQLEDASGHPFMTFEAFCEEPWPRGLGLANGVGPAILAESDGGKRLGVLASECAAARELAGPKERGEKGGRGRKATYNNKQLHGTSKDYILSELKTSAPAILERYQSGEFKSAQSARREAVKQGLLQPRKQRTPLDELRSAWKKADTTQRDTFLKEINP